MTQVADDPFIGQRVPLSPAVTQAAPDPFIGQRVPSQSAPRPTSGADQFIGMKVDVAPTTKPPASPSLPTPAASSAPIPTTTPPPTLVPQSPVAPAPFDIQPTIGGSPTQFAASITNLPASPPPSTNAPAPTPAASEGVVSDADAQKYQQHQQTAKSLVTKGVIPLDQESREALAKDLDNPARAPAAVQYRKQIFGRLMGTPEFDALAPADQDAIINRALEVTKGRPDPHDLAEQLNQSDRTNSETAARMARPLDPNDYRDMHEKAWDLYTKESLDRSASSSNRTEANNPDAFKAKDYYAAVSQQIGTEIAAKLQRDPAFNKLSPADQQQQFAKTYYQTAPADYVAGNPYDPKRSPQAVAAATRIDFSHGAIGEFGLGAINELTAKVQRIGTALGAAQNYSSADADISNPKHATARSAGGVAANVGSLAAQTIVAPETVIPGMTAEGFGGGVENARQLGLSPVATVALATEQGAFNAAVAAVLPGAKPGVPLANEIAKSFLINSGLRISQATIEPQILKALGAARPGTSIDAFNDALRNKEGWATDLLFTALHGIHSAINDHGAPKPAEQVPAPAEQVVAPEATPKASTTPQPAASPAPPVDRATFIKDHLETATNIKKANPDMTSHEAMQYAIELKGAGEKANDPFIGQKVTQSAPQSQSPTPQAGAEVAAPDFIPDKNPTVPQGSAPTSAETPDAATRAPAANETETPPSPLRENAGWKLHLAVKSENQEAVSQHLKELGIPHKVGGSGGQDGKDITAYAGSRDAADAAAKSLNANVGDKLESPHGETLRDDTDFGGKVRGRFDAAGDKDFHQYGRNGVPFRNVDQNNITFGGASEAEKQTMLEQSHAALTKKYGDFYTGNPSPTPPPEAATHTAESAAPEKISSFITAKGSTYDVDEQGRTTRTKTLHEGHDPGDVGAKERSEKTVYMNPDDATAIGMHGNLSGKKTIIEQGGKLYAAMWNDADNKWGLSPTEKNGRAFTTQPEKGKSPVELWQGKNGEWGKWHAGNDITDLSHATPQPQAGPGKATESAGNPPVGVESPKSEPGIKGASGEQERLLPKPEPGEQPDTTGIKNAVSEQFRKDNGLNKLNQPDTRHFDTMMQAGIDADKANPSAIRTLIDELRKNPEKQLDTLTESGLAMKHRVDLAKEFTRLRDDLKAARDMKSPEGETMSLAKLDAHRKVIQEFTDLTKRTGTATARALAFRRSMSAMDYSLSNMEATHEAAKGSPLTRKEQDSLAEQSDKREKLIEDLKKSEAAANDRAAEAESQRDHANRLREAAEAKAKEAASPKNPKVIAKRTAPLAERINSRIDKLTAAALERIKARGINIMAGVDPANFADHTIVGVGELAKGLVNFTDWSASMVKKFGDYVKPHLSELFDAAKKTHERIKAEAEQDDIVGKMKARRDDGVDAGEMQPYLRKLALDLIHGGIKQREPLLDALHEKVKEVFPNITRNEVRDTLSGYGDYKALNKDVDHVALRDVNQQSQKLAQLEALQRGEAPQKTGVERQSPNDETRALTKQVNEAKRKAGIVTTDPESQLKTTLDSMKTRARNTINDLQSEIDTKQRIVKGKTIPISDTELDALKKQVADLRKAHAEVFGKPGMNDEQRLELATKAAHRAADNWQKRTDDARKGVFNDAKTRRTVSNDEILSLRAKTKAAKDLVAELKANDPAQKVLAEQRGNAAFRARLSEKAADLQDRMVRGDYAKKPAPERLRLDDASESKKAEVARIEKNFDAKIAEYEAKRRPWWEKTMDYAARVPRTNALSGYRIFAKLLSASALGPAFHVADEAVGLPARITPGLSSIARHASIEGEGLVPATHLQAASKAVTKGLLDAYKKLATRGHMDDMDAVYGTGQHKSDALEFFGMLHGVEKSLLKRYAFEFALKKQTRWALKNGLDPTQPHVQMLLGTAAYEHAMRALFMDKSAWVQGIRAMTGTWGREAPGRAPSAIVAGKAAMYATKALVPVATVGSNIAKRSIQRIAGLPIGVSEAIHAAYKGTFADHPSTLTPDQAVAKAQLANHILRNIKSGSVGLGLLMLGMAARNNIGGLYTPGDDKKKDGDVPYGSIRIGGFNVPGTFLHHPAMEMLQAGATAGKTWDEVSRSGGSMPVAALRSGGKVSAGLAMSDPFISAATKDLGAIDSKKQEGVMGEIIRGLLVPQLVQQLAEDTDKEKRKPKGVLQNVESGIPGLRQTLPTK